MGRRGSWQGRVGEVRAVGDDGDPFARHATVGQRLRGDGGGGDDRIDPVEAPPFEGVDGCQVGTRGLQVGLGPLDRRKAVDLVHHRPRPILREQRHDAPRLTSLGGRPPLPGDAVRHLGPEPFGTAQRMHLRRRGPSDRDRPLLLVRGEAVPRQAVQQPVIGGAQQRAGEPGDVGRRALRRREAVVRGIQGSAIEDVRHAGTMPDRGPAVGALR